MDIRLQQLSYSSQLLLHECPRKYQLYKLQAQRAEEDTKTSLTFAFGHALGEAIQMHWSGLSKEEILFKLFMAWQPDLLEDNPKQAKSFFLVLVAFDKYCAMRDQGFLSEYELVYLNEKPACELSFIIHLPNGFTYKGFVDIVLRDKETSELMVLELKTTSATNVNPTQYQNSAQAIGYSVVLDAISPNASSYKVLYLPYFTKSKEYEAMPFEKSYLQRAEWIKELLISCDVISLYETHQVYPKHGESCLSYFRDCDYLNLCTMSLDKITSPLEESDIEIIHKKNAADFDVNLTVNDLIFAQLSKE